MIKKYVSDFTIRLGPMTTRGSLYGVRKSKSKGKGNGSYNYVSPDGRRVRRVFETVTGDKEIFTEDQLEKAVVTTTVTDVNHDGSASQIAEEIVVVSKDKIAEAKKSSLPSNVLNLTVHNLSEVEDQLFPSDNNAYVFVPNADDPANAQWYALLVQMMFQNKAFIGICNLKNNEGLFRLTLWRNLIVLQKQLYPSDVEDHKAFAVPTVKPDALAKAVNLLDKITVEFKAEDYRNQTVDRLAALEEAVHGGKVTSTPVESAGEIDMLAALEAFEAL